MGQPQPLIRPFEVAFVHLHLNGPASIVSVWIICQHALKMICSDPLAQTQTQHQNLADPA